MNSVSQGCDQLTSLCFKDSGVLQAYVKTAQRRPGVRLRSSTYVLFFDKTSLLYISGLYDGNFFIAQESSFLGVIG